MCGRPGGRRLVRAFCLSWWQAVGVGWCGCVLVPGAGASGRVFAFFWGCAVKNRNVQRVGFVLRLEPGSFVGVGGVQVAALRGAQVFGTRGRALKGAVRVIWACEVVEVVAGVEGAVVGSVGFVSPEIAAALDGEADLAGANRRVAKVAGDGS